MGIQLLKQRGDRFLRKAFQICGVDVIGFYKPEQPSEFQRVFLRSLTQGMPSREQEENG